MKRTNVVLDEDLLIEATRTLGQKTYSATINHALQEAIRMQQVRNLSNYLGQGLWEGDLPEMRGDAPVVSQESSK